MGIHAFILHDGKITDANSPEFCAGQLGLLAGWGVFTTLRVAQGALFAWERHWARMSRDARLMNVAMPPDAAEVEASLLRLIEANGQFDCTMRLVVVRNGGGMWEGPMAGGASAASRASDVIAMTADSKPWGDSARLSVHPNGRFAAGEFAGAKINSWAQNLTWAERAQLEGFDETVLLNERGQVAECTSANIFAVLDGSVYTPPLGDGCLPGITREVLLSEINVEGVRIAERSLGLEDLYRAEEVFITSTTRDLLPVREIAGHALNRGSAVRDRVTGAFQEFFYRDVARRRLVTASV